MTDSFHIRNCFASLSPSGQHPLRGAGGLLSLCSPAGCLRQAISAALRFAVLGSAYGISPARRLAVMNLALRGIEADFGPEHADTFRRVQHPNLRAAFVIATTLRDSASEPSKPDAADGKRPTTTFLKK